MATRFSVTDKTFKEIKALIAKGDKSYTQIGADYDLSKSTIVHINKALNFNEYKRNRRKQSYNRQHRNELKAHARRKFVLTVVGIAVIEFVLVLLLLREV